MSGVAVLQEMDARLADAQRQASAAQSEADQLAARREGLRAEEAEALRDLARLRLHEMTNGKAALDQLDAAGAQVRESLRRRAAGLDQAHEAIEAAREALHEAEAARTAEAARHRAAQEAEAAALARASEQLADDPAYRAMAEKAEEAERVAQHAEQKAAYAQRDLDDKGRPYRDDPLFAYLWDRGYGTGRYRAMPLVRLVDGWVARLAGYEGNRRSYALLSDLPGTIADHAGRMRAEADQAVRSMVEHRRVLAGLPVGGQRPSAAAMEAADDRVEAAQAALAEAEARRSALAAGEDAASQQAMRALEAAIGAQSLRTLRAEAARTPTRDDDAIVARLEVAAAERGRIDRTLHDAQAQAAAARHRLSDLQALRHDMRGRGVERSDWSFASQALVGMLVGEVLRGALSRDGFWDRMERHRTPDTRHGTGQPGPWGQPRPAPGPWSGSSGGSWWGSDTAAPGKGWGDGGPKQPGGWSDGGGGFSTGGTSDSGGGFRTGGSV